MGCNNSVFTRLKDLIPNIKIVKCKCHIAHLSAKNAMKCLPCEEFVSSVYNYISVSSKSPSQRSQRSQSEKSVDSILEYLEDPMMHHYHNFLEAVLGLFTHANKVLQSQKPIISEHDTDIMRKLYTNLLRMNMNKNYVDRTSVKDIDPLNTSEFKDLFAMDVGRITNSSLKEDAIEVDVESEEELITA